MDNNNFFKQEFTPPTAFYFSVNFEGFNEMDCAFQEVSGLNVTLSTEEIREGGNNSFVHQLPTAPKYENLVLKRCLSYNSKLETWCRDALEGLKFDPKDIKLSLLDANGGILASWTIVKAFPISWELAQLNSTSNQLAIESLTLKYRHFRKV
ncbi:phage tail protein [Algibacter sp.]|uniref:phage tail protein n=1 Tax=Algibacter sp. TaxID=1872428 RepID=UPI003C766653